MNSNINGVKTLSTKHIRSGQRCECWVVESIKSSIFLYYLMIFMLFALTSCESSQQHVDNDSVVFRKVYYDGKKLQFDTTKIDNRIHLVSLTGVLVYYGVPFKVDSLQNLWVDKKLLEDKDFLWNLSTKSEDSIWMKNHIWKSDW